MTRSPSVKPKDEKLFTRPGFQKPNDRFVQELPPIIPHGTAGRNFQQITKVAKT